MERTAIDFSRMDAGSLLQLLDRSEGFLTEDTSNGNLGHHDRDGKLLWITDNGFAKMALMDLKNDGKIEQQETLAPEDRMEHYPGTVGVLGKFPLHVFRKVEA